MKVVSMLVFAIAIISVIGIGIYTIISAFYIIPKFMEGRVMTAEELWQCMPLKLRKFAKFCFAGFGISFALMMLIILIHKL
jgi:hypothetical protein